MLLLTAYVFIIGLCLGSFANVVIYRLPLIIFVRDWRRHSDPDDRRELLEIIDEDPARAREKLNAAMAQNLNIATTRSRCPRCGRVLGVRELVPVLSWLLQGGKCRGCGGRIAARYALVELLCGLAAAAVWLRFGLVGDWVSLALYELVTLLLVILTFIDLDYRILPNELTYSGMVLGLLAALAPHYPWSDQTLHLAGLGEALLGLLVAGGLSRAIYELGSRMYGREVYGMGDVKLMCMLGLLLGWKLGLLTLVLANCYGAFFGVAMVMLSSLLQRLKLQWMPAVTLKSMVPFGPYIVFAAFTVILAGPELITGYQNFMEL